jgi:hypothetical protein
MDKGQFPGSDADLGVTGGLENATLDEQKAST